MDLIQSSEKKIGSEKQLHKFTNHEYNDMRYYALAHDTALRDHSETKTESQTANYLYSGDRPASATVIPMASAVKG